MQWSEKKDRIYKFFFKFSQKKVCNLSLTLIEPQASVAVPTCSTNICLSSYSTQQQVLQQAPSDYTSMVSFLTKSVEN